MLDTRHRNAQRTGVGRDRVTNGQLDCFSRTGREMNVVRLGRKNRGDELLGMGHRQCGTLAVNVLNTIGIAEIFDHHFDRHLKHPKIHGRGGVMVQIDRPAFGHLCNVSGGNMLIHGSRP